MSYKIEKEIIELRIPMLEAYDSGNEKLGDEFAAMTKSNLNKEMVDRWNIYLDFDLHTKVKRYGYIGSARLFKIFSLKVIA